jgi:membrane-bound inhibitor of C-type lysozyme
MKTLAALAVLALLAACSSTHGGPRTDWSCDGGAAFSARFPSSGRAEIFAGGQVYTLRSAISASGARYSDGTVEFWEHQGEATLNGARGGPYTNCRSS